MDLSFEQLMQKHKHIIFIVVITFVLLSIASIGARWWIQQESSSHEKVYAEHLRNVELIVREIKNAPGLTFDERKSFSEQLSAVPDSKASYQTALEFWASDSARFLKLRYPKCFVGDFSMSTTPRQVTVAGRYWKGCDNFETHKGPIEIAADFVLLNIVIPVLCLLFIVFMMYFSQNAFLSIPQREALERVIREQQERDSSHGNSLSIQEIEKLRRILEKQDKNSGSR